CQSLEILDASGVQVAKSKQNWSGNNGTIAFKDGQSFQFSSKGFWRPTWTLSAGSGRPLFSIDVRSKTVHLLSDPDTQDDRVNLLMIFVWRIIQQGEEDAASAAIASVVAVAATS